MRDKSLEAWQKRILILCWVAYACLYFGRVNLSIAIPELQDYLRVDKAQVGILGTLFFWVYGTGQLINGYLGDRVSSRKYIFAGLFVTGLMNLFFGFAASLPLMCALWAVNGYFQSMLWGPMSRTIACWIPRERRDSAAIGISTSMVGGYLLAWGFSGQVLARTDWNWVFWIPGIVILLYSFIWYSKARNNPEDAGLAVTDMECGTGKSVGEDESTPQKSYRMAEVIKATRLWFVIAACLAQGIVKEGIGLWAPTFFMEVHKLDIKAASGFILSIPLMNLGGMLLAGWLNKKLKNREKTAAAALFAIGILMLAGLMTLGKGSAALGIVFLGLTSAMMYGANTLLLGVIPMRYAGYGKVSAVAGLLDFSSYLAAGLTASITGIVVEWSGWNGVLVLWLAVTVAGTSALLLSQVHRGKQIDKATDLYR